MWPSLVIGLLVGAAYLGGFLVSRALGLSGGEQSLVTIAACGLAGAVGVLLTRRRPQ